MKYVKRSDTDFVIDIIETQKNSGYNVVPKSIDPYNAYDIADIQAYASEHPEDEVIWDEETGLYIPVLEHEAQ